MLEGFEGRALLQAGRYTGALFLLKAGTSAGALSLLKTGI